MTLIERFLKYVNIPSASNAGSDTIPSTPEQLALMDELHGVVMLHISRPGRLADPVNIGIVEQPMTAVCPLRFQQSVTPLPRA